jgi:hypothetical protein
MAHELFISLTVITHIQLVLMLNLCKKVAHKRTYNFV